MSERDWREVGVGCDRFLALRRATIAREILAELAAAAPEGAQPDRYGDGELVTGLEARVAELASPGSRGARWRDPRTSSPRCVCGRSARAGASSSSSRSR